MKKENLLIVVVIFTLLFACKSEPKVAEKDELIFKCRT